MGKTLPLLAAGYQTQSYPYQTQSYPYQTQSYPYQTQSYPYQTQSYPYQTQSYPYQTQSYPYQTQSYPYQSYPYPEQRAPSCTKYQKTNARPSHKKKKIRQTIISIKQSFFGNAPELIELSDGSVWRVLDSCSPALYWLIGDVIEIGIDLPSWTNNFFPELYLVNCSLLTDSEVSVQPETSMNFSTISTSVITHIQIEGSSICLTTAQGAQSQQWVVHPQTWSPLGYDVGRRVIIAYSGDGQTALMTENGTQYCIIE